MRAALIQGDLVVNVIEYDPEAQFEPGEEIKLLELPPLPADPGAISSDYYPVCPGWRYRNGTFRPPATESLSVAEAASQVLATYRNTFDDAPTSVMFDVNGATATVAVTDGSAELAITPPATGPITVSVVGRDVAPVTIRGN